MSQVLKLVRQRRDEELWQLCCGFLDLNVDQFMSIQKQLLLEQIELLKRSQLGRKVMRGAMPRTVDEFREQVPLTTYADYCPELLEQREDLLPAKPALWTKTSGRSGEYPHKWVPVSRRFWDEAALNFCAMILFGSSSNRGDLVFKDGFKCLHAAGLPPFLTGNVARELQNNLGFRFLPPLQESEGMGFEQRVEEGFRLALSNGMDVFFGLAGILVAMGEKFRQRSGSTKVRQYFSQPGTLLRLARGLIRSKLAGRPMMPKDLWSLKLIVSMGTDSRVYKEKIRELWGRTPLDIYGNSETAVIATQTWDYSDMVFFPNLNFLEFIPEGEHFKWQLDHTYQPKTILLSEVRAGENYELVITNFHGGALARYRIGDMVRITSLRNDKLGIDLPQMTFERRADDLIDLGFMRLTERVIWQAIENAGLPYVGWTASKELVGTPRLHLYVELDGSYTGTADYAARMVYEEIKKIDDGLYVYSDLPSLEALLDFKPVVVTLLPQGVFSTYKEIMKSRGAKFSHLRPPHINPTADVLSLLGASLESRSGNQVALAG